MRDNYNDLIDFLKQFTPKGNDSIIPISQNGEFIHILDEFFKVVLVPMGFTVPYSKVKEVTHHCGGELSIMLKSGCCLYFRVEEHTLLGDVPIRDIRFCSWEADDDN